MKKKQLRNSALAFIILMGVVSLFSDMTHEGANSIVGVYLSLSGASAAAIGFVTGLGVFVGYSLRLLTGFIADKTKKYWLLTVVGYIIDVLAIPALALVPNGGWIAACIIMVIQRTGKALKKPAKNTLVSFAASQYGQGKSFALLELMDQFGAFLGPLIVFAVLLLKNNGDLFSAYSLCFAVLGIPAIITIVLLLFAKKAYPHPEEFEKENGNKEKFRIKKSFVLYTAGISLVAFGFVDFPLITLHTAKYALISNDTLPLLYSGAMALDAISALFFGKIFDKYGIKVLMLSTVLAAPFAALVFFADSSWLLFAGVALWGIGMGAQESILKATVSTIVPKENRSAGFGIFETVFGLFWFLGSWLTGALYDISILWLVIVSVAVQVVAIPVFYMTARAFQKEKIMAV
jgi:MFS family permease